MTHLAAVASADLRTLHRTGYLWATVAIFAVLLALALQVSELDFEAFADILAAIIVFDSVTAPVLLVGLMLLLERGDGCLAALAATPLRPRALLAGRTLTVATVCAAQMLLLVLIAYDGPTAPALLVGGLLGLAAIATLLGVVIVAPFRTLYGFVPPMAGWAAALGAPGYGALLGWDPAWLAWHPAAPSMALIEAAFAPSSAGRIVYGVAGSAAWLALSGWLAGRALRAMQRRAAGG